MLETHKLKNIIKQTLQTFRGMWLRIDGLQRVVIIFPTNLSSATLKLFSSREGPISIPLVSIPDLMTSLTNNICRSNAMPIPSLCHKSPGSFHFNFWVQTQPPQEIAQAGLQNHPRSCGKKCPSLQLSRTHKWGHIRPSNSSPANPSNEWKTWAMPGKNSISIPQPDRPQKGET